MLNRQDKFFPAENFPRHMKRIWCWHRIFFFPYSLNDRRNTATWRFNAESRSRQNQDRWRRGRWPYIAVSGRVRAVAAAAHLLAVALQHPLHLAYICSHVPVTPFRFLVRETSWPREHFRGRVDKHLSYTGHEGIPTRKGVEKSLSHFQHKCKTFRNSSGETYHTQSVRR